MSTFVASYAPVRLVQTAALPSYAYSAGVITGTAALGTVFDGVTPSVGDRLLVVLEGTKNGIYVATAIGGSSYSLTRASDLDSSSHFVGGVQVDVVDGTTNAGGNNTGSRWGLLTQGTVVLDATVTTWARFCTSAAIYIYANQPPYNMFNDPLHRTDQQPRLLQLAWDLHLIAATLSIPAYAIIGSGDYLLEHTVPFRGRTGLIGLSPENTRFVTGNKTGGWTFIAGHDGTRPPTILGHAVDSNTHGGFANHPWQPSDSSGTLDGWINLTADYASSAHHAFLWNDGAPETPITQFEFLFNFECEALGGSGSRWHVASCRGAKTSKDPVETCFRITCADDGSMQAVLRLHDETSGSYSAATVTNGGGGTSTITGDSTVKPTADTTVVIYIVNGGTVGTAGITFLYSVDGKIFNASVANAIALGSATSITIGPSDSPFFFAKFNLSAGTVVTGASYTFTTSGVETTYTLNLPASTVQVGNKYQCALQYDASASGAIRFYCTKFGSTITPVTTTGHGGILQRSYESLVVGFGQNYGEENNDMRAAQFAYGVIRVSKGGIVLPSGTCPTTILGQPIPADQLVFLGFGYDPYWVVDSQLREVDGTIYGWLGTRGQTSDGYVDVYHRRANPDQPKNNRFESFSLFGAGSGIIECQSANADYRNLQFQCSGDQLRVVGPNPFTSHSDLAFQGGRRQLVGCTAGLTLLGNCTFQSGLIQLQAFASAVDQHGVLFLNPGNPDTRHCVLLDGAADSDTNIRNLAVDGEELQSSYRPREMLRTYARHNRRTTIGGSITTPYNLPMAWLGESDGILDLETYPLAMVSGRSCSISFEGSAAAPICLNAASVSIDSATPAKPVPWVNVSGATYVQGRGAPPNGTNLATGNETLLYSGGAVRRMLASTTAGNTDKTLSVTGVVEGDVWEFPVGSQGNQLRFINGGAAGGTLVTIAASTPQWVYKFQALGGHLGLNWVQVQ